MARRTDGGVRFRPVGSSRHPRTPVRYSPGGTGCPAIEQAIEQLYHGQNEESFWALMGALNYALELETHVLVPLQTAPGTPPTPAPWAENPVPQQKAKGLALWTLKNKDRTWLPLFTSSAAACVDRSTAARPMADYTLQDAMELVLDAPDIDGVVIDPWGHSATLDEALLNGLLHADHNPEEPGDEEVEAGREAARAGDWRMAADHYDEAAQQGNAMGLSLLADCLYRGRGEMQNKTEARRMWRTAADHGEVLAMLSLGEDPAHLSAPCPGRDPLRLGQKSHGTGGRGRPGLCHPGPGEGTGCGRIAGRSGTAAAGTGRSEAPEYGLQHRFFTIGLKNGHRNRVR